MIYFFIGLGIVSLAGILAIIWRQLAFVRHHDLTAEAADEDFFELVRRKIDLFYYRFGFFFKTLAHYSYLYSLFTLRHLVVIVRFVLARVERKFSRLIDSVHGRGVVFHTGGPASPFLTQIKDHKEAALAGLARRSMAEGWKNNKQ